jgi:hypothetical protein
LGTIFDFVEDHDQARAAIAFATLARRSVGTAKDEAFRIHLGILNLAYKVAHIETPSKHATEAEEFQALLGYCVPDLVDVEFDMLRKMRGQNYGRD